MQHLDSLTRDISDLKDKVSLLEIDLQKQRINNMDTKSGMNKLIDSIIGDLQGIEDKLIKSPRLR
jgi:hypothetical protein